jgi:hypothetical protein
VFARHARDVARRLPKAEVLATDIDAKWNRLFRFWAAASLRREPRNFSFRRESLYESQARDLMAVCFFGGCGSLTDAALRLAVSSGATAVVGRACCHENIGNNFRTETLYPTAWSIGHRVKNRIYRWCAESFQHYTHFSAAMSTYPLSQTMRRHWSASDLLRYARHSVDCAQCRFAIDLDRVIYLIENDFVVLGYEESMFVAIRRDAANDLPELDVGGLEAWGSALLGPNVQGRRPDA